MMKIGLVVVATGKYKKFLSNLLYSADRYFFSGDEVSCFLFTDKPEESVDYSGRITLHQFKVTHEPWPAPTLKRFHYFLSQDSRLSEVSYIYYCDVDMQFVGPVGHEILPDEQGLTATAHPGFFKRLPLNLYQRIKKKLGLKHKTKDIVLRGTYETNNKSKAFVSSQEGDIYFAGGFFGGLSTSFLNMARQLRENIECDMLNGVLAVWHDESHLNRYLIDHPPKVLNPSYCCPDNKDIGFERRLLALTKNHADIRAE